MDRKAYFDQYYTDNAEDKKRKRRERYAKQKNMMWGLFIQLRYSDKESLQSIYCYKHKDKALERVKRMQSIIIKYRLVPVDGECGFCKWKKWERSLK